MSRKNNVFNGVAIITLILVILYFNYENNNIEYLNDAEIQWLKKQETIIYAANENAPPLRFVDEIDNQYKGVVFDYIN